MKKSRLELISEFNDAPLDTLFKQQTIAAYLDISHAMLERDRWAGRGIPFLKLGNQKHSPVRYRKSDVLKWLNDGQKLNSTSEYGYVKFEQSDYTVDINR